jgi:hypothetical protein
MQKIFLILILFTGSLSKTYSNHPILLRDTTVTEKRFPHWGIIVGMAGATGFAFTIDENVSKFMYDNQNEFWNDFTKGSNIGGEIKIMIPALLLTYGASIISKNKKFRLTTEASIKSVICTGIITEAGKQIFGRARPFTGLGAFHLTPLPFLKDEYKSMPSGHTSLAFAIFTPFAENYSRWFYCIPVAVAFGRVYQNRHWTSDVIAGGTIGFISGYFFAHGRRQIEIFPNGIKIWF